MWLVPLYVLTAALLIYLGAATFYLLAMAAAYFIARERGGDRSGSLHRFAVLVPAHNEELLLATVCRSLLQVEYPREKYQIFVIADNCSDRTAEVGRRLGVRVLERDDPEHRGKGQALDWGLKRIPLDQFDAVFIVDADNAVDAGVLRELNRLLHRGEQAIQCFNAVGNRNDSWFTQLLFVSRTICNLLLHEAKYRLGLSSYLMGNGLCFRADLLRKRGWTAFSAGEDWEYYAQLVEDGINIGFAARAKVFHQESRSLSQATSQRLRWSSGRFRVAKEFGLRLLLRGVREKSWRMVDASLPLIFPNFSLLVSLSLAGLGVALLLPASAMGIVLAGSFAAVVAGQFLLFLVGSSISGSPWKIFCALLYAPVFLVWKSVIDVLCFTGIYKNTKWVRTRRHQSGG